MTPVQFGTVPKPATCNPCAGSLTARPVSFQQWWVAVRARVESIQGYSGHKDSDHLISFVEDTKDTVQKVFCVMGEPKSSLFLVQRLRDYVGVDAVMPKLGESVTIHF